MVKNKEETPYFKWEHPGGKLRELGSEKLTDAELLSILISSGIKRNFGRKISRKDR